MLKINTIKNLARIIPLLVYFWPSSVLANHTVQHTLETNPPPLVFIFVVIRNVLFLLTGVVSLGFLAMLVVGGFRLLLAGGDPKALGEAKGVLTFAALGLFLAFSAFLIISLIAAVTGVGGLGVINVATNLLKPRELCRQAYVGPDPSAPRNDLVVIAQICQIFFPQETAP